MNVAHDLILFDLDGTLSDPLVGIGRSINYALGHFGYPPRELNKLASFIGPPIDEAFKTLTGVTSKSQIEAFVARYRERYGDIGYSENTIYPGVAETLASLEKNGIPLCICTSKRTDFAEQILEMFGLRSYFRFVNGGDIRIQKWQQIEGLLSQGIVSKSSVMVGDRAVDLHAAHRNGLHAAGVLWGYGSYEELSRELPRYLFSTPTEFSKLTGISDNRTKAE